MLLSPPPKTSRPLPKTENQSNVLMNALFTPAWVHTQLLSVRAGSQGCRDGTDGARNVRATFLCE